MKIGILSDSHDHVQAFGQAIDLFAQRSCEFLIHAGDLCSPFIARMIRESGLKHAAVFGNNDGDRTALSKVIDIAPSPRHVSLDSRDIVIFHEPFINDYIDPLKVDLLVYGHTHMKDVSQRGEMMTVNPGTVSGALVGRKSCAVYDTRTREVEIIEL